MSEILLAVLAVLATVILNTLALYFWRPWLGAYGAEKAKNFARQEDLEKILLEVRAVTATQKQIEAKLSGTEWNRQILWNKRAELYSCAMSVLCELEASTIQLKDLKRPLTVLDPTEHQLARDRRLALNLDLRKLEGAMILFATRATSEALSAYFSVSTKATTFEEELEALEELHSAVCEQAKAHLHLRESVDD